MNHIVTYPVAIDKPIQMLQTAIYNSLTTAVDSELGETNCEIYGRCNLIASGDGDMIPYVFDVRTYHDYKEVLFDDRKAFVAFFGVDTTVNHTTEGGNASIHLIAMCDLSQMYSNTQRRDAQVRKVIRDILRKGLFGTQLQSEVSGVSAVFDGYKTFPEFDIHPYHCFRFNLQLHFKP